MNNKIKLADQLGWCMTTRDALTNLTEAISIVQSNVRNTLIAMHQSETIPNETVEYFKNTYQEFNQKADDMIRIIHNNHISYINDRADDVKENINIFIG